jgi:hypothetical protein
MAYESEIQGQTYIFEVDYGEESKAARVIVRPAQGGPEGLFLVLSDGTIEPAEDVLGFGPNPAAGDGLWPLPPLELIEDARRIARAKNPEQDAGE